MPTIAISLGVPINLLQNVVYALPPVHCFLYCEVAAATFEQSNTLAFTLATALAPDANEQTPVSGAFIRSTAGNANCVFVRQ